MATTRDSAFYTSQVTNKYLQRADTYRQRPIAIPFEFTIVSASAAADVYNLFVLKKGERVVGLDAGSGILGASAGAGVTVQIGITGVDTDLFMLATDMDVAAVGTLAPTGQGYTPTADVVVSALIGAVAGVVGRVVKGVMWVLPAES